MKYFLLTLVLCSNIYANNTDGVWAICRPLENTDPAAFQDCLLAMDYLHPEHGFNGNIEIDPLIDAENEIIVDDISKEVDEILKDNKE